MGSHGVVCSKMIDFSFYGRSLQSQPRGCVFKYFFTVLSTTRGKKGWESVYMFMLKVQNRREAGCDTTVECVKLLCNTEPPLTLTRAHIVPVSKMVVILLTKRPGTNAVNTRPWDSRELCQCNHIHVVRYVEISFHPDPYGAFTKVQRKGADSWRVHSQTHKWMNETNWKRTQGTWPSRGAQAKTTSCRVTKIRVNRCSVNIMESDGNLRYSKKNKNLCTWNIKQLRKACDFLPQTAADDPVTGYLCRLVASAAFETRSKLSLPVFLPAQRCESRNRDPTRCVTSLVWGSVRKARSLITVVRVVCFCCLWERRNVSITWRRLFKLWL